MQNGRVFDWNDLRCFLAVLRDGTTLAASRRLGVSQSTAARRIAALETALGLELFDKRPSGYTPTEAATALLPLAETAETALEAFAATASAHRRGMIGVVRLTTNDVFASAFLLRALGEFRTSYPAVRVELVTSDRFLDLAAGEADVALRAGAPPTDRGLVGRRLAVDRWSVYCSRAYMEANGAPRRAEDMAQHPVFSVDDAFPRSPTVEWVERHVPPQAVALRQNSISGLFASLKSGLGVTMMSDFVAAGDPDLVLCFTPDIQDHNEIWLVTHERLRKTPRVRALMDFLGGFFTARRQAEAQSAPVA